MGFADHPYCVVLQTHDPDSTDSAQESAYADEVLVLALTHSQDDGKIIRGKLMINGDAKRLARALLATDFRDAIRGAIRDALDESSFYRERAKALEKRLEHEQEWETYFPGITNREYSTYADTCACGMARRLDEIEAADLVASWCGFQRERITIVTTEKPLERNRHGDIRCEDGVTNYDRRPVLVHTFSVRTPDGAPRGEGNIHYIRFEVLGRLYELMDGALRVL